MEVRFLAVMSRLDLIATSAESDYQIKKNESVVAAIDLAAIDRYRVYQRLFL